MSLVRCQQDNCNRLCDGTRTVNGKVACKDCDELDQWRRNRDDSQRKAVRPKNDHDWDQ